MNGIAGVFLKPKDFCLYRNYKIYRRPGGADRTLASVFYDHSCRICREEMMRIHGKDTMNRLLMVDISSTDFDPEAWGVRRQDLEDALHVLTADGVWLVGVPAIDYVYTQVGLGWLFLLARWQPVGTMLDKAYRVFARNRHAISACLPGGEKFRACKNGSCSLNERAGSMGGEHD